MNIRDALVLLLELVLTVAVVAAAIWIVERYLFKIPDLVKLTICLVLLLLFLIFLVRGGRPPLITW